MVTVLLAVAAAAAFVSLPYWLPPLVVGLRMRLFTRINGQAALQLPNEEFGPAAFRELYSHLEAGGRSRGARLSDLFWYWLAPGPEMHQEHIENGPRYEKIAGLTRRMLTVPRADIEARVERCAVHSSARWSARKWRLVRLRDAMMPIWADFFHEIAFGEECTPAVRRLIIDNANDVVTALKCCGLRHMRKRRRLTAYLIEKLQAGEFPYAFPRGFTVEEQAHYLQCTYFNTAIVQMSEAMAHLLMTLGRDDRLQRRLLTSEHDRRLYDRVLNESLRMFPLFGIAHRITTGEIEFRGRALKDGSVVCFNYPEFHKAGFDRPESFEPDRWERCPMKNSNHIPFGMASNRPCPARGLALISMRALTRWLLRHYRFSTSLAQTRSLPNRGPCLMLARGERSIGESTERAFHLLMKMRDRWEDAFRSILQLVLGTIMILDARRLRLCERYFERLDPPTVRTGIAPREDR